MLRIDLRKPDDSDYVPKTINRVQIYQRCDANEIYHQTNFEVRANDGNPGTVYGSPSLVGGKFCGTYRAWFPTGGTSFTVPCQTPVADAKGMDSENHSSQSRRRMAQLWRRSMEFLHWKCPSSEFQLASCLFDD